MERKRKRKDIKRERERERNTLPREKERIKKETVKV